MLVEVVVKLNDIFKKLEISNKVRKYKINKWFIYIMILIIIALYGVYLSLTTIVVAFGLGNKWYTFWIARFLDQKNPKLIR